MENISSDTICPSCHAPVSQNENFCPNCGFKLKEPPVSTSIGRQIFIYFFSIILAPLGIVYAIKYLRQSDPKARSVGVVVIILTLLAVAFMIWVTRAFTLWQYQSVLGL